MTQQLSVNLIQIDRKSEGLIYEATEGNSDFDFFDKLNKDIRFLYSLENNGSKSINVFESENLFLQKKYIQALLMKHFRQKGYPTRKNFIDSIDVLVKGPARGDQIEYKKYNIKIDRNLITENLSLIINFTGISSVLNKNLSTLAQTHISKVVCKNEILHIKELSETQREDSYPILNRKLEASLGIQNQTYRKEYNKYKRLHFEILSFIQGPFAEVITRPEHLKFTSTNLSLIPNDLVKNLSTGSNKLVFGNENTDFIPLNGLRKFGPLALPTKKVKFIFVFNERNKNEANTFYSYLKKGFQSFPGLEPLVGLPLDLNREKSIILDCNNSEAPDKIKQELAKRDFGDGYKYLAFVFTDVNKDSQDSQEKQIYYQIKENLLRNGIVSQVIDPNKIKLESYGFFLPNIAISVLAKVGGIPWRLSSKPEKELVIGLGASRDLERDKVYIGNAICFSNTGTFKDFNATKSESLSEIAEFLKTQIITYRDQFSDISKLIIHYYKDLSQREASIFEEMLKKLHLNIPYVVLVISKSESEDVIPFDENFEGKMPVSGTCFKFKPNQYLICNNSRYTAFTQTRIADFPFPLKVKIYGSDRNFTRDQEETLILLDQIYQFSKMYWKSIKQKTRPVTMLYSEMIAEKLSHFQEDLPKHPMLEGSLWFL